MSENMSENPTQNGPSDAPNPNPSPPPGRKGGFSLKNLKNIGLTNWIFIGLIAGTLLGLLCNVALSPESGLFKVGINGFLFVIGRGFIRLMQMLVVPLVFTSIVCGAAAMGSGAMLGRVGGMTIVLYLLTTFVAITLALFLGLMINPGLGLDLGAITQMEVKAAKATSLADTLLNIFPTNVVSAMASGAMLQIIVAALILGYVIARMSPTRFLRRMLPVMGFAFSTSSSNATIPLNMETLERKIGVSPRITGFTIPLGATINMDGTAIMQGVAMLMGVDRLVDMGRTVVNVTGDAVVTTCVARTNGMLDRSVFDSEEGGTEQARN